MNDIYIGFVAILLGFLMLPKGRLKERKRNDKVIAVIDDNCVRCRSCIRRCRHNVLAMNNDEKGLHIVVKNPEQCTGCGKCIQVCDFNALKLVTKT